MPNIWTVNFSYTGIEMRLLGKAFTIIIIIIIFIIVVIITPLPYISLLKTCARSIYSAFL